MLRAGVPLLQAFEIVARGHKNPRFARLMMDIKSRVESGSSLSQAFREHPGQFDALYCNLVNAGETAGILDGILDRLATYKEKILAIKSKIKSALFYPISVVTVAIIVVWVIMVFVIPAFKTVFANFGANLPAPTLIVIAMSDFFVSYWWAMAAIVAGALTTFRKLPMHSPIKPAMDAATSGAISTTGIPANATALGSLDDGAELEDRQIHGDHQAADHNAQEHDDDGLQQARQRGHRVVDLALEEVRDLGQHAVE